MNFLLTPLVKKLLIINFGVFAIAIFVFSKTGIDINDYFGLHSFFSERFQVYQFVTYIFMHGYMNEFGNISFTHIFSNMFALFIFGPMLESRWGSKRFLFFYLFTGVGAGLSYWAVNAYEVYQLHEGVTLYLQHPGPDEFVRFVSKFDRSVMHSLVEKIELFSDHPDNVELINWSKDFAVKQYVRESMFSMVGASGSIYGILMAFGMLFPNTVLFMIFLPIPIKAKYIVAFYGLSELYIQIQNAPGDNVAHFAHLAGMVFAFFLVRYWNKRRDVFY